MKIIESIRIKYYRSIHNTTRGHVTHINTSHMNIIVGSNDVGKSNYLRALNLFFNGVSEPGQLFNFWQDYPIQRHGVRREENRIEIELVINPPTKQYFKNNGPVCWTKVWKDNSAGVTETIHYVNGGKFTTDYRSAYYKWLKKIKFRYVPAIKSQQYFNDLMFSLYDVLQKDTNELEKEFNQQIKQKTSLISQQISNRLSIESVLQFRGSFRDLFDRLQFGSLDGKIMLSHRGDGVKVRHIPVILQNIASAELKESRNREPVSSTIWGFEEPENNLEFESARKLADSFIEYLDKVNFDKTTIHEDEGLQIFLTTHSPVFYMLSNTNSSKINSFFVTKSENGVSTIRPITNEQNIIIEHEMKLMPLIELSRHWAGIKQKIESLSLENSEVKKQIKTFTESSITNHKCIFLTEDKKQGLVEKLLVSNGFNMGETDLRSYKGCTNIGSAEVLNSYLKDKFKDSYPRIIVHRDKDYFTPDEIKEEIEKYAKIGITLFITKGTDIESYFISKEHISACHPELSNTEIEEIILQAKEEKKDIAITALKTKEFGEKHKNKSTHLMAYIDNYYTENMDLLFHGKEVFKRVKSLIQEKTKKNALIEKEGNTLLEQNLKNISNQIWT